MPKRQVFSRAKRPRLVTLEAVACPACHQDAAVPAAGGWVSWEQQRGSSGRGLGARPRLPGEA